MATSLIYGFFFLESSKESLKMIIASAQNRVIKLERNHSIKRYGLESTDPRPAGKSIGSIHLKR